MYKIMNKQTRNVIYTNLNTIKECKEMILSLEQEDERDGTYFENMYIYEPMLINGCTTLGGYIVETNNNNIPLVEVVKKEHNSQINTYYFDNKRKVKVMVGLRKHQNMWIATIQLFNTKKETKSYKENTYIISEENLPKQYELIVIELANIYEKMNLK